MNRDQKILESLNNYLMNRFNYRSKPARLKNADQIIDADRRLFRIYLRLTHVELSEYCPKNTIVFANISFKETRKGNGSHLVEFLANLAIKYNYKYLAIENANKNSSAFAERLGFKLVKSYTYSDEKTSFSINQYLVETEELLSVFSRREM